MNNAELRELLDFAVDTAWQAGKITLEYFQTRHSVERKPDKSVVTIADRRAEEAIRHLVRSRFPNHSIIGEEYGAETASSDYTWIVDPIDGTQSFVHGVPFYGVLLGLEYQKKPVLGVVNCPALDEMVYAAQGMMTDLQGFDELRALLVGQHGWTLLTAVNLMLFSLLHNPCATTILTIYKETLSVKWATIGALLPLALAFVVTFVTASVSRVVFGL